MVTEIVQDMDSSLLF